MRRALLLVLLVVLGCSKSTLDRKTAMEKINEGFTKNRERIPVRIGRIGSHCETLANGEELDLSPTIRTADPAGIMARAAGYTDVVPDGEGFWKVSLTEQGRAFANAYHIVPEAPPPTSHCGYQIYSLPLATGQVKEITGIVADEKTSQVEFLWTWTLTDLGKGLRPEGKVYGALDEVHRDSLKRWLSVNPGPTLPIPAPSDEELKVPKHETAQFVKYDDGWRVK